jgi:RimJ/RimL family protein N-acetyltransferase
MDPNILMGTLVRLTAEEPQVLAEAISRWDSDSEYRRLLDSEPSNLFSVKKMTEWIQKDQEQDPPKFYPFGIRTLEGDKLVGYTGLNGDFFPHGEAFVGIGIGERDFWGKGLARMP